MMLTHRKPMTNLLSVNDWVDRFFQDDFFKDDWKATDVWSGGYPTTDVFETKDEYVFKLEVPGLSNDDIQIELTGNILTVKGEHKEESNVEEGNYRHTERFNGTFNRSFTLPGEADGNKIDAAMKDGVLELRIPKAEEKKVKSIPISVN
ncbi:MAG: Hsp20/alpha crystallin family protein [bacterium]|nr:Hsp20/alpha crystallin family protein [bacterium]